MPYVLIKEITYLLRRPALSWQFELVPPTSATSQPSLADGAVHYTTLQNSGRGQPPRS